jgi:fido (protein-threonine AMPylation protein)
MSFDLAVWHSDGALTDKEAADIYVRPCKNWPFLEGENSAVRAFYSALTKRWPEIDTVPDDKIDYSPWSYALDHSGMAVVMPCVNGSPSCGVR